MSEIEAEVYQKIAKNRPECRYTKSFLEFVSIFNPAPPMVSITYHSNVLSKLSDYFLEFGQVRILDIGCGECERSIQLLKEIYRRMHQDYTKRAFFITGLDVSVEQLTTARRILGSNTALIRAFELKRMAFPATSNELGESDELKNDQFHLALDSFGGFTYCMDKLLGVLEVTRILKKGAKLLLSAEEDMGIIFLDSQGSFKIPLKLFLEYVGFENEHSSEYNSLYVLKKERNLDELRELRECVSLGILGHNLQDTDPAYIPSSDRTELQKASRMLDEICK